jgi:hypothetical protein
VTREGWTFIFDFSWLARSIIIGAIKTEGFRQKPALVENL